MSEILNPQLENPLLPIVKKRDRSVDVAKGILIIMVVIGHSGIDFAKYIYWFHMPVFFILSGLFFKKINSYEEFLAFVKKNVRSMVIPYFAYLILVNLYVLIQFANAGDNSGLFKRLYLMFYGGRALGVENGVFWFISVLFLTRILLGYLSIYFKQQTVFYITCGLFMLGVLESLIFQHLSKIQRFPLDIDVIAVACFFYYAGHMIKPYLKEISKALAVVSLVFIAVIFTGDYLGLYDFRLDMKNSVYYNLPFVVFLPLLFCIVTLEAGKLFAGTKYAAAFLEYLGENSLVIMYLHLFVNFFLKNNFHLNYGVAVFTALGVFVPLGFGAIAERNKLSRMLFIGK